MNYSKLIALMAIALIVLGFLHAGNVTDKTTFTATTGGTINHYECMVTGFAGYGSVKTKIPYFSAVATNTGDGVAYNYASDTTNGASWTILKAGRWGLLNFGIVGYNQEVGFSRNASPNDCTVSIYIVLFPTNLGFVDNTTVATQVIMAPAYIITHLSSNDVVRPHTDGSSPDMPGKSRCGIIYIAP